MKKIILAPVALLLLSFTALHYELKKSTAEVNSFEGVLVFVDSKPVMPYEVLGEMINQVPPMEDYESFRDKFVSRVKKKYPAADAVILKLNPTAPKGIAIKFK